MNSPYKLIAIGIVGASVLLLAYWGLSGRPAANDATAALVLELKGHNQQIAELEKAGYGPDGREALARYLTEARRNGVASQADLRVKLNTIERSINRILALLDVVEPVSDSEEFRSAARSFRSYGISWLDREDALIELYMLGGGYGVSAPAYPKELLKLAEGETP